MNKYQELDILKNHFRMKIVRLHLLGFLILANSENDFQGKYRRITEGDRRGFYRLDDILIQNIIRNER